MLPTGLRLLFSISVQQDREESFSSAYEDDKDDEDELNQVIYYSKFLVFIDLNKYFTK